MAEGAAPCLAGHPVDLRRLGVEEIPRVHAAGHDRSEALPAPLSARPLVEISSEAAAPVRTRSEAMKESTKAFLKKVLPGFILLPIYWLRSYKLVQGKLTYRQDGLYATCNTDFLREPKFAEAFRLGRQAGVLNDTPIHYRAYIACWAAL